MLKEVEFYTLNRPDWMACVIGAISKVYLSECEVWPLQRAKGLAWCTHAGYGHMAGVGIQNLTHIKIWDFEMWGPIKSR